jgi:hypothetical protein
MRRKRILLWSWINRDYMVYQDDEYRGIVEEDTQNPNYIEVGVRV